MTRQTLAAAALFLVCLPAVAFAEQKVHAEAKISVEVPAGWKSEGDEHSLTMTDPAEEAVVALMVLDAKDLDKAAAALDKEVGKAVKDLKWEGEPAELKLNGMDAVAVEGKGKIDGQSVDVGVFLVVTPAAKVLLALGAVETAKAKKHEAALEKLLRSIKPAK